MDYTVRLDTFEGPLDLLLFLIRRAEVEVTEIPIATITDQYLRYLESFTAGVVESPGEGGEAKSRPIDIERAGEFLVMAATLMEIKSRMLTPVPTRSSDGEGQGSGESGRSQAKGVDPRSELILQLLEYKRFRDATEQLEHYRDEYFAKYPAAALRAIEAPEPALSEESVHDDDRPTVDLEDTTLIDLVEAFARIMRTVDFSRVGEHRVVFDDTPVEIHAEDILLRLRQLDAREVDVPGTDGAAPSTRLRRVMEFVTIFKGRKRSEAIGLFLAVLELVKQQRIRVRQAQRWESPSSAIQPSVPQPRVDGSEPIDVAERSESPEDRAALPATAEQTFTLELIEDDELEPLEQEQLGGGVPQGIKESLRAV